MNLLSKAEMKKVLGGIEQLPGCQSHDQCNGMFPICVIVTYMGVTQGACCSVAEMNDKKNVCGGGSEV